MSLRLSLHDALKTGILFGFAGLIISVLLYGVEVFRARSLLEETGPRLSAGDALRRPTARGLEVRAIDGPKHERWT